MSAEPSDIRVGDIWVFHSNARAMFRTVTVIGEKRIAYKDGQGKERACLRSSFNRWWRGAELYFRSEAPSNAEVKPS